MDDRKASDNIAIGLRKWLASFGANMQHIREAEEI